MKLLDTSVLIDILRGEEKIEDKLENIEEELASCFPVQCELYRGTKLARNTEEGKREVDNLLEELTMLEADRKAAKEFSELREKYSQINEFDLMIASICISQNSGIITRDEDFEKIEELETDIY